MDLRSIELNKTVRLGKIKCHRISLICGKQSIQTSGQIKQSLNKPVSGDSGTVVSKREGQLDAISIMGKMQPPRYKAET